MGDKIDIASC